VKKFNAFLNTCANWQLRAVSAGASLVIGVIIALIYAPAVTLVIFLGAYLTLTGPDWRDGLRSGTLVPDWEQMKADAKTSASVATTSKRMTNTRRKQLARQSRTKNKHK